MDTYIVISHDFDFLDKITDCILDTDYLRRYQKQQKHIKNGTIYPQKYSWE